MTKYCGILKTNKSVSLGAFIDQMYSWSTHMKYFVFVHIILRGHDQSLSYIFAISAAKVIIAGYEQTDTNLHETHILYILVAAVGLPLQSVGMREPFLVQRSRMCVVDSWMLALVSVFMLVLFLNCLLIFYKREGEEGRERGLVLCVMASCPSAYVRERGKAVVDFCTTVCCTLRCVHV